LKFLAKLAYWFRKVRWRIKSTHEIEKQVDYTEFQSRMIESYRKFVLGS